LWGEQRNEVVIHRPIGIGAYADLERIRGVVVVLVAGEIGDADIPRARIEDWLSGEGGRSLVAMALEVQDAALACRPNTGGGALAFSFALAASRRVLHARASWIVAEDLLLGDADETAVAALHRIAAEVIVFGEPGIVDHAAALVFGAVVVRRVDQGDGRVDIRAAAEGQACLDDRRSVAADA